MTEVTKEALELAERDLPSLLRQAAAELHKHAYDYDWKANTKHCALCGADQIAGQKSHGADCLVTRLRIASTTGLGGGS